MCANSLSQEDNRNFSTCLVFILVIVDNLDSINLLISFESM